MYADTYQDDDRYDFWPDPAEYSDAGYGADDDYRDETVPVSFEYDDDYRADDADQDETYYGFDDIASCDDDCAVCFPYEEEY